MSRTPSLDDMYTHFLKIPQQPHQLHDLFVTPHIEHSDPTWGPDPCFENH